MSALERVILKIEPSGHASVRSASLDTGRLSADGVAIWCSFPLSRAGEVGHGPSGDAVSDPGADLVLVGLAAGDSLGHADIAVVIGLAHRSPLRSRTRMVSAAHSCSPNRR